MKTTTATHGDTSARHGVGDVNLFDAAPNHGASRRRAGGFWRATGGVGTVHHLAFRAASDEEQLARRAEIESRGFAITPVIDRQYFHSVYFREPGGVLFEVATDGPGFAIDEAVSELGTHLKLPPMYESNRTRIERDLPPLRLPHAAVGEGR